ncbi:DUF4381 domain-containing protein [Sphingobacterium corticibacter]|uniref:Uncharacterized protein n=1 Tax=Sphingobacterium corticibacter TaxID=2171749 RepID=A0A2T8HNC4_9SPHI|nr:hypothetical protein [Sphingobacterium corticibacter]PVH26937.1 hypothetical protein DC487_04905 [Sphingobacterium corticibacter]
MKDHEVEFPALKSVPDKLMTVVLYGFFFVLMALVSICILAIPLAFQLEHGGTPGWKSIIFAVLYYALILWILWWIFGRYIKTRRKRLKEIVVDREGVHYFSIDGTKNSILYAELEKSNKIYEKDIDWKPRIRTAVGYLYGHKSGSHLKISFDSNHFGATHLIKNKNILIGHFLKGVKQFDSGFTISDSVFSEFHIDKDTFLYDRQEHLKFAIICIVVLVLIALAICYLTRITE